MEKIVELNGCRLTVVFEPLLIRIKTPKVLKKLLAKDIDSRSVQLVKAIKQDYQALMGKELMISEDSMIVEIWGHIYAANLAKAIKNLIKLQLIENFADLIIERSEVIDCGESEVDSNRKVWDVLANFKGTILSFLPKHLK